MEGNFSDRVNRMDPSTGVTYTEWSATASEFRILRQTPLKWLHKSLGRSQDLRSYRNGPGPDTLQNMAWRVVLIYLDSLKITHLEAMPWSIALRFWKILTKNQLDTVALWQIFVKAFRNDMVKQRNEVPFSYKAPWIYCPTSQQSIGSYTAHLNNSNFDWITALTILDDGPISRSEWLQLSKLTNLGSLWVDSRFRDGGSLDDSVLKAWSSSAQLSNCFSVLRFFHLHSRAAFNCDVLSYLHDLPLLSVVHLRTMTKTEYLNPNIESKTVWHSFTPPTPCEELSVVYLTPAKKPSHAALAVLNNMRPNEAIQRHCPLDDAPLLSVMFGPDPTKNWDISGTRFNFQSYWFLRAEEEPYINHSKRQLIQTSDKYSKPKRLRLRDEALTDTNELLQQFAR